MAGGRRVTVLLVRALCCAATIATASAQAAPASLQAAFPMFATLDNRSNAPTGAEARRAFLAWLRANGDGFDKIKIDDDGAGGNALVASAEIAAGEVIGRIPYNMTLSRFGVSRAHSKREELLSLFAKDFANSSEAAVNRDVAGCLFLLLELEAGENSFFAPYISMLPSPPKLHTSHYWSQGYVGLASSLHKTLASHATSQKESFQSLLQAYNAQVQQFFDPETSVIAMRAEGILPLQWARAIQSSRGFWWNASLIPLADMANHVPSGAQRDVPVEAGGSIHMEFDDTNRMIVISLTGTNVKAQQQIYNNYGKHDNARLLANYGFTVWPNRYHCIQLLEDAPAEDEDLKRVAVCDGSVGLTREAWRYYRLLSLSVASQEEALRERWAENDKQGVGSVTSEFVDLISEIKALRSISQDLGRAIQPRTQAQRKCSRKAPKEEGGSRRMSARERALVKMACDLVDKEADLITRSQVSVKEMYRKVVATCSKDKECHSFLKELQDRVKETRQHLEL